jgi:hypothetical protein
MTGKYNRGVFESTSDCKAVTWRLDNAGKHLTMEPFQHGGEEDVDAVKLPLELDTAQFKAQAPTCLTCLICPADMAPDQPPAAERLVAG